MDRTQNGKFNTRSNAECTHWKKKYTILLKRAEEIERENLRLINRLYEIKNITKRLKKERRFIVRRLDQHNDNFREVRFYHDVEFLPEGRSVRIKHKRRNRNKNDDDDEDEDEETSNNEKQPLGVPPQKPMSAFFRYCQAQHLQILQKNAGMPHDTIKKSLAEEWSTMLESQKKKYYAVYKEERNNYENEVTQFFDSFQQGAQRSCKTFIKQEPEEEEESIIEEEEDEDDEEVEDEEGEEEEEDKEEGEDIAEDGNYDNDKDNSIEMDTNEDKTVANNDNNDDGDTEEEVNISPPIRTLANEEEGGEGSKEQLSDDDSGKMDTSSQDVEQASLNSSSLSEQGSASSDDQDEIG